MQKMLVPALLATLSTAAQALQPLNDAELLASTLDTMIASVLTQGGAGGDASIKDSVVYKAFRAAKKTELPDGSVRYVIDNFEATPAQLLSTGNILPGAENLQNLGKVRVQNADVNLGLKILGRN